MEEGEHTVVDTVDEEGTPNLRLPDTQEGGPLLLRETMTEKGREAEVETGVKKGKGGVEVGIGERE
jgi:hypothetical protein